MRLFCKLFLSCGAVAGLAACSVNPATGDKQFTAFMSPSQEQSVGAQEHANIIQMFGAYDNPAIADYVQRVGERVAQNTERADVDYTFTVLDTPMVNAFALPGGYVYISRGLLQQANSEAELAAVLGHEIGHVTGRHSAERYSRGVLTTLGAGILAAATDSNTLAQVAGVGSDLYIKSYSRGQEHQADNLGLRYLYQAGYEPEAMASFLANLEQYTAFESRLTGTSTPMPFNYFSTHPQTRDRIVEVSAEAASYPENESLVRREEHLRMIDGIIYGDSERHGFTRNQNFYHPSMGFTFSVPQGFRLINQPEQVVAVGENGAIIVFDAARTPSAMDPLAYMRNVWMQGEPIESAEQILINGMPAATAAFDANVNGRPMQLRIVAVEWKPDQFFRFQMAIPRGAPGSLVEDLKRTTYSFRKMSEQERQTIKPWRVQVVTAGQGDTVASLASRTAFEDMKEERFRVLNALSAREELVPGRSYKIVTP